VRPKADEQPA